MDQVLAFLEPGRQFSKDSIRLVKRCTKPDRKGKQKSPVMFLPYVHNHTFTRSLWTSRAFHFIHIIITLSLIELTFYFTFTNVKNSIFCRIPEDCCSHRYWFLLDGLHWLLRQAHPHSHQQHHCVSFIFYSLVASNAHHNLAYSS